MIDQAEMLFWKTITADRKAGPAEFQAYLEAYPAGSFANLAKLRLQRYSPLIVSRPGLAQEIVEATAQLGGVPVAWLLSARRAKRLARLRQIAAYLMREMTPMSLPQIGRMLGNRDHTTVMHSLKIMQKFEEMQPRSADAQATLDMLEMARAALTPSATPASQDSASAIAAQ